LELEAKYFARPGPNGVLNLVETAASTSHNFQDTRRGRYNVGT
jgi:hypothetical protein